MENKKKKKRKVVRVDGGWGPKQRTHRCQPLLRLMVL